MGLTDRDGYVIPDFLLEIWDESIFSTHKIDRLKGDVFVLDLLNEIED